MLLMTMELKKTILMRYTSVFYMLINLKLIVQLLIYYFKTSALHVTGILPRRSSFYEL